MRDVISRIGIKMTYLIKISFTVNDHFLFCKIYCFCSSEIIFGFGSKVLPLTFRRFSSVANFGTFYFPLKIKILAKRKRELTQNSQLREAAVSGCAVSHFLIFASNFQLLFEPQFPFQ
jgi:hypothetical protein